MRIFSGSRYDEMTSNAVESWNNQIKKYWHLPITNMVDSIRVLLMSQMCTRLEENMKWTTMLCPSMEEKVKDTLKETKSWIIKKATCTLKSNVSLHK